ncbi:MAG TPA: hypothetical protein VF468_10745 [Actinomycetota bacterium]|nr:hypothetical protein [Actinomycetota bacterium]
MQETATRHPPVEAAAGHGKGSGPWLSMPRLWLIVVLGAIGLMALARVPSAIDLAYHVKVGELMVAEGALPRTDALAWTTAGRPWLDQNWGAQLVLYGIWRLGGFPLVVVVNALVAVATWALVAAACRRRTANLRLIAGAVLAGYAAAAATFSARPQMFSLLLFAVELYLLEVARTRPRAALAIPLLMPLWANLHGAFVVGVGLLAIEVAAAVWRRDRSGAVRYLLVTAASVAGLLVNPWGVGVLGYAISLPTNRVVSKLITEWAPTSIHDLTGILVLGAVVVLVVALVRAPAPHRVPEQLLRMALLGGLAFWAVRGVAWFGLALPVALCALARPRPLRPVGEDRGVPAVNVLVLATLVVGAGGGLAAGQAGPRRLASAADRRPGGHRRLAGRQPAAGTDVQLPGVGLLPGVPLRAAGAGGIRLPHRAAAGGPLDPLPGRDRGPLGRRAAAG